jgi:hypothetical protein
MKSPSHILGALVTALLYPRGGLPVESYCLWVALFFIGRIVLAAWIVPIVLISAMMSDSGTTIAVNGAMCMMYAMSLLVWAALLWSWRCVAACFCIIVFLFLFAFIFDACEKIQWLFGPVLLILCVVVTEAIPAPIRTIWAFLQWCYLNEDDTDSIENKNGEVMLLHTLV